MKLGHSKGRKPSPFKIYLTIKNLFTNFHFSCFDMEGLRGKGRWEAKEDLCDPFWFNVENNARNMFRRRIAFK
jgi:hypothetical protein